jgi:hypothetical protein
MAASPRPSVATTSSSPQPTSPAGRNTFRAKVWVPAVAAGGISFNARMHDLRHAHASWLLAGGADLPNSDQKNLDAFEGPALRAESAHPGHIKVDTSVDAVLVARRFSYFGGAGPTIPTTLRNDFEMDLVHPSQGHRCRFPQELVDAAIAWFEALDRGVLGCPADWARLPKD